MINYAENQVTHVSKLLDAEWVLFPVHGVNPAGACTCGKADCDKSAGKHPVHSNWNAPESTSGATFDQSLLALNSWNVGVNCKASGFFVIDIDPRNGGDESFISLEAMLEGEIPSTVESVTGQYRVNGRLVRGRHLYFKCDASEELIGNLKKMGFKGIDIKHNGYVLLPPSSHITGVPYQWVAGKEPWTIQMAEPSDTLWDLLRKKNFMDSKKKPLLEASPIQIERARGDSPATPYASAALAGEVEKIRQLRLGDNRNDELNASAFRMGQLMAEGQIGYEECKEALAEAGREAFFGEEAEDEIQNVLRAKGGGFESGFNSPRSDAPLPVAIPIISTGPTSDEAEFVVRMNKIDWHDLWADSREEQWLLPGIVCEGRGHSIYSDAGVGKSLLIRELSACLASGKAAFGMPALPPMSVLYLDFENSPKGDIKRSLIDMGFSPAELDNLHLLSYPQFSPFDLAIGGRELVRAIEIFKPRLVVIDTFSRAVHGKENDNDTWNAFYNFTGKMLKFLEIAYIRLDHVGKNAEAGMRGGSAKKGDIDLVWYFKAISGKEKFVLKNEKSRVPLTQDKFFISRHLEPLRHIIDIGVTGLDWDGMVRKTTIFEKSKSLLGDLFERYPTHPRGLAAIWGDLQDECQKNGITRRALDEARISFFAEGEPETT